MEDLDKNNEDAIKTEDQEPQEKESQVEEGQDKEPEHQEPKVEEVLDKEQQVSETRNKEIQEIELQKKTKLPDAYRKKFSAFLAALVRLLEGVAAGFALYGIVRMLVPFLELLKEGIPGWNQIYGQLLETAAGNQLQLSGEALAGLQIEEYTSYITNALALPGILILAFLALLMISLVLSVTEGITALVLRFGGKGAGTIRRIHQFRFALTILHMALFTFEFTVFFLSMDRMAAATNTEVMPLRIAFGILAAIYYLITSLIACYHSDIAKAMKTMAYEAEYALPGEMEHTHLSGLSFLSGLYYFLNTLIFVTGYFLSANIIDSDSALPLIDVSAGNFDPMIVLAMAAGFCLLLALKYFAVSMCNRNFKKAHGSMD